MAPHPGNGPGRRAVDPQGPDTGRGASEFCLLEGDAGNFVSQERHGAKRAVSASRTLRASSSQTFPSSSWNKAAAAPGSTSCSSSKIASKNKTATFSIRAIRSSRPRRPRTMLRPFRTGSIPTSEKVRRGESRSRRRTLFRTYAADLALRTASYHPIRHFRNTDQPDLGCTPSRGPESKTRGKAVKGLASSAASSRETVSDSKRSSSGQVGRALHIGTMVNHAAGTTRR